MSNSLSNEPASRVNNLANSGYRPLMAGEASPDARNVVPNNNQNSQNNNDSGVDDNQIQNAELTPAGKELPRTYAVEPFFKPGTITDIAACGIIFVLIYFYTYTYQYICWIPYADIAVAGVNGGEYYAECWMPWEGKYGAFIAFAIIWRWYHYNQMNRKATIKNLPYSCTQLSLAGGQIDCVFIGTMHLGERSAMDVIDASNAILKHTGRAPDCYAIELDRDRCIKMFGNTLGSAVPKPDSKKKDKKDSKKNGNSNKPESEAPIFTKKQVETIFAQEKLQCHGSPSTACAFAGSMAASSSSDGKKKIVIPRYNQLMKFKNSNNNQNHENNTFRAAAVGEWNFMLENTDSSVKGSCVIDPNNEYGESDDFNSGLVAGKIVVVKRRVPDIVARREGSDKDSETSPRSAKMNTSTISTVESTRIIDSSPKASLLDNDATAKVGTGISNGHSASADNVIVDIDVESIVSSDAKNKNTAPKVVRTRTTSKDGKEELSAHDEELYYNSYEPPRHARIAFAAQKAGAKGVLVLTTTATRQWERKRTQFIYNEKYEKSGGCGCCGGSKACPGSSFLSDIGRVFSKCCCAASDDMFYHYENSVILTSCPGGGLAGSREEKADRKLMKDARSDLKSGRFPAIPLVELDEHSWRMGVLNEEKMKEDKEAAERAKNGEESKKDSKDSKEDEKVTSEEPGKCPVSGVLSIVDVDAVHGLNNKDSPYLKSNKKLYYASATGTSTAQSVNSSNEWKRKWTNANDQFSSTNSSSSSSTNWNEMEIEFTPKVDRLHIMSVAPRKRFIKSAALMGSGIGILYGVIGMAGVKAGMEFQKALALAKRLHAPCLGVDEQIGGIFARVSAALIPRPWNFWKATTFWLSVPRIYFGYYWFPTSFDALGQMVRAIFYLRLYMVAAFVTAGFTASLYIEGLAYLVTLAIAKIIAAFNDKVEKTWSSNSNSQNTNTNKATNQGDAFDADHIQGYLIGTFVFLIIPALYQGFLHQRNQFMYYNLVHMAKNNFPETLTNVDLIQKGEESTLSSSSNAMLNDSSLMSPMSTDVSHSNSNVAITSGTRVSGTDLEASVGLVNRNGNNGNAPQKKITMVAVFGALHVPGLLDIGNHESVFLKRAEEIRRAAAENQASRRRG